MNDRILCWRCREAEVRLKGLPCSECRVILEAEYEFMRALNGGKNLYIPEDWDGPAIPPTHGIPYLAQGYNSNQEFSFAHIPGRRRLEDVLQGFRGGSRRTRDRSEFDSEE